MIKLNMKGATWDSLFLTFVKLLTTFTSIAITKILSVGLSLAEYGTYSQATVIISISTSILLLGLGDAINYFYNSQSSDISREKKINIVNTIYFIEIVLGVALASVLIIGRNILANYFSNDMLNNIIIIVSIKPMFSNLIYFYQILYVSTGKAKIIAIRNFVVSILKMIAIYIMVNVFNSVEAIFIALIVLDLLQMIIFKLHFAKESFLVNPFKIVRDYIKPILVYGIPMGIFAFTNMLTRDIDKLIIGKMADTETMAIYTNCAKILPFDLIAVSFATVLIPYIMKYVTAKENDNAILLFKNYIKIGYYSVWIFGFAVLITSRQAITFLYSDEYIIGNTVFILYLFDSMIRFASMHLVLTANGKTKTLMKYSILTLIINAILNAILYKLLGMIGPAVSTLVTALIYIGLVLNKTIKILEAEWVQILDIKDMVRFIFILLASGVGIYLFNNWLLSVGLQQYICMIISMFIFILANFAFNAKRIFDVLKTINQLKM